MPGRDSASLTVLGAGGPGPAASAADMPALVPALERLVEAYIELAMVSARFKVFVIATRWLLCPVMGTVRLMFFLVQLWVYAYSQQLPPRVCLS